MKEILPLETQVKFGDSESTEYKGVITGICIKKYTTTYEITFWKEHEQKTIWLFEEELKLSKKVKKESVGFKEVAA